MKEKSKALKQDRSKAVEAAKLETIHQLRADAAGIDLGAEELYVAVPEERDEKPVRSFATFTADLYALARWLKECQVKTVAMEATGVYWIPVYDVLEAEGLEVYLVNARHIQNVSGRKSDILDCQWLQQLHSFGLLRNSFRPRDEIRTLRSLVRHRENLIRYRSAHIQHMQKALRQMNVLLDQVVSDITGVTGMAIIRDIVQGNREPEQLAKHRDPRCKKSEEEIAHSLYGNYRTEFLFELRQAVELYDFYGEKIGDCDKEIDDLYTLLNQAADPNDLPPSPKARRPKRQGTAPEFDLRTHLYHLAGTDLTQIDGIDVLTTQTLLAEIGADVSAWPTEKHFSSWLHLSPNHRVSGGKVLKRSTSSGVVRASLALRQAAQSLSRSQSALGAFYRRIRAKHGPSHANVATAHKLARIVYRMLKYKDNYIDPGPDQYTERQRQRVIRNLRRQAARLGLTLQSPQPLPA